MSDPRLPKQQRTAEKLEEELGHDPTDPALLLYSDHKPQPRRATNVWGILLWIGVCVLAIGVATCFALTDGPAAP